MSGFAPSGLAVSGVAGAFCCSIEGFVSVDTPENPKLKPLFNEKLVVCVVVVVDDGGCFIAFANSWKFNGLDCLDASVPNENRGVLEEMPLVVVVVV